MSENHAAPQAGAILDIGAEIGALVLYVGAGWHEREIHVHPVGSPGRRTHTVVRRHPLPSGGAVFAALFPALPAGDYVVAGRGGPPFMTVRGGEVTEARLSA
jgi:hypothetical protein